VEDIHVVCGDGRRRRRRRQGRSALTDATVTLTFSAQLADTERQVTVRRQSQLLETLDNVVDAMLTPAAVRRLLLPLSADVTDVREVRRTWEPVVCRDGEVRNGDDLAACCELATLVNELR